MIDDEPFQSPAINFLIISLRALSATAIRFEDFLYFVYSLFTVRFDLINVGLTNNYIARIMNYFH